MCYTLKCCDMETCDLPDIHALVLRPATLVLVHMYQTNTCTYVTTITQTILEESQYNKARILILIIESLFN